jgi:hypothetical protein
MQRRLALESEMDNPKDYMMEAFDPVLSVFNIKIAIT